MEANPSTALLDVTPTGSQTQVITPDEIPEQVNCIKRKNYCEMHLINLESIEIN